MFEPRESETFIPLRVQKTLKRLGVYATVFVTMLFIAVPMYIMVAIAVQSPSTIFSSGNINILIEKPTLRNFRILFGSTDASRYLMNSLIVSTSATLLSTTIAVTAGYGMTRFEFRNKSYAARAILFSYMFSPIVLAIPLYLIFFRLGLLDTHFTLTLALSAVAAPFSIWLMWQYFQTIPISYEENAWMAGAGRLRAVWDVVLPVARPGYISAAIFAFAVAWNDYTMARVLLSNDNMYTLTVGASLFLDRSTIGWGETMAAGVIMSLPPLVVVVFLQKYLLQGFDVGGVE